MSLNWRYNKLYYSKEVLFAMPLKLFRKIDELDKIRLKKGNNEIKAVFNSLVKNNAEKAIKLINDKNLQFTSLFIIGPGIKDKSILDNLNQRNKCSLEVIKGVPFDTYSRQEYYSVLKWILETGYREDGLNEEYDEVLDTAAIILSKVYKDNQSLPVIEEMIFSRYRQGAFIYDLVWAFFEAANWEDLIRLAKRLRSSDPKDNELARKFLNFIPCLDINKSPEMQYRCSIKWLKENRSLLFYTGETNLQTCDPVRFAVSEKKTGGRK